MTNVDGLKDAVAAKMRLGGDTAPRSVGARRRFQSVDEDCALVANDKATAYHVVVPKS